MNLTPFVTFSLHCGPLSQTFQLNSHISSPHFEKLLFSVFPILKDSLPSHLRFQPLDTNDTPLNFVSFVDTLPYIHQKAFAVLIDQDHLDGPFKSFDKEYHDVRMFSSPQPQPIPPKVSGYHNRGRSGDAPLQRSSAKHSQQVDRTFFSYLDQMLDDEMLEAREFFFVKCLFFEQRGLVLDFAIEALRDQDYLRFAEIVRKLLEIKGFTQKKAGRQSVMEVVEEILASNFDTTEANVIRDLVRLQEGNVMAAISVFEQENDEEEFVDTLNHILSKTRDIKERKFLQPNEQPKYVRPNEDTYEESKKIEEHPLRSAPQEDANIFRKTPKTQEEPLRNKETPSQYREEPTEEPLRNKETPSQYREEPTVEAPIKNKATETKQVKNPTRGSQTQATSESSSKKDSMIAVIFKTLLEETEESFEAYEIGFSKHLFNIRDETLLRILNTAETIEAAVESIKTRIQEFFGSFLKSQFKAEEIEYILANKCERSNEICSVFCSFKEKGVFDDLLQDLNSVFEAKQNQQDKKKSTEGGKFASVVQSRVTQKKNSFRMCLMKEPTQQTVNIRNSQNQIPMIVTINQTENQVLKELLQTFHMREDIGNEKFKRNQKIFEELVAKIPLDKDILAKLRALLERNHFGMLKVLNLYEKLNGNPKKIKAEIDKMMKRDSIREIDDVPTSPSLRSKIYKFNTFKQTIHELMDRYQLISPKQQKLFLYLYLSEDLALLGAFEVFLVTNSLQDFVENLRIIDKFHFFKTNLDFDEIEQFDENVEFQLSILFAYRKYVKSEQKTSLEKIIRAGDQSLLALYHKFQQHRQMDEFIRGFVELAEEKAQELKRLEQKMFESRLNGDKISKNLDSLDTFRMSKFLKHVKYYDIIEDLVKSDHKLIQTAFEIYEMTKDKADFIENIELIYVLEYKRKFKEIIENNKFLNRKLKAEELHFLFDCIDLDIPNILAIFEVYMLNIHTGEEVDEEEGKNALKELVEAIEIALRVYKKEIALFEKSFYK